MRPAGPGAPRPCDAERFPGRQPHRKRPCAEKNGTFRDDGGQLAQQRLQPLRRMGRVVRRRDEIGLAGRRGGRHGARARRLRGLVGPFGLQQHVGGHEAARFGDIAEDLFARLHGTRLQELRQHDENGSRAGVAAPRQVAEPALARDG